MIFLNVQFRMVMQNIKRLLVKKQKKVKAIKYPAVARSILFVFSSYERGWNRKMVSFKNSLSMCV